MFTKHNILPKDHIGKRKTNQPTIKEKARRIAKTIRFLKDNPQSTASDLSRGISVRVATASDLLNKLANNNLAIKSTKEILVTGKGDAFGSYSKKRNLSVFTLKPGIDETSTIPIKENIELNIRLEELLNYLKRKVKSQTAFTSELVEYWGYSNWIIIQTMKKLEENNLVRGSKIKKPVIDPKGRNQRVTEYLWTLQ